MIIKPATSLPHEAWLSLRSALWPSGTEINHRREIAAFVADPRKYAQFIAFDEENHPVGLAEGSLRYDYVNGTETSPVAFLEGLYVIPAARRRGTAKQLIETVAAWASRGSLGPLGRPARKSIRSP
jgi:aminoglycoside 6'-N-acetyltransferase I